MTIEDRYLSVTSIIKMRTDVLCLTTDLVKTTLQVHQQLFVETIQLKKLNKDGFR